MRRVAAAACAVFLVVFQARADHVYLVGGSVLEGNATRQGDRVLVELSSGQLALPASSVERIEESETDSDRVAARLAKLKPDDVKGRLDLARFCHDHDMRAKETELLTAVLAIDPNHAEARSRLGYVRQPDGSWVTQDEQRRAAGMVKIDGVWMTAAERLDLERRQAETQVARIARDKAELELSTKQVELAQKQAEAATPPAAQPAPNSAWPIYSYGYSYGYGVPWPSPMPSRGCAFGACIPHLAPPRPGPDPFPINGAHDPRDMSGYIPGVRNPRMGR